MNENVKQLALECYNPYGNFDLDKFAELIVEECCNRLSEETIRHDGYGYNQHELYNRLRKHFGVDK